MPDIQQIAHLDALLAASGSTLTNAAGGRGMHLVVKGEFTDLLGGVVRLIVGTPVTVVKPARAESRPGKCEHCGQEVMFIRSAKTRKWIPVDRKPYQIVAADGTVHRGSEVHMASCPMRDRIIAERAREQHKAATAPKE